MKQINFQTHPARHATTFLLLLFSVCCRLVSAADLTGEEILRKIDANMISENRKSRNTMIVHDPRGSRTITLQSWVQGFDQAFTEYLFPPKDKGTKMLKLGNELWIYTPESDRIIKIAGHMLRQSMMGSDVSYEDFMEDRKLTQMYHAKVTGSEKTGDRDCHVLSLTARVTDVAYYSRKMWVDRERFLPLKEERYAKSGKLLKRFTIEEVHKVDDRWYPRKMTFKDMMKSGSGTEFRVDSIEFNVKIEPYIFSKASLKK